MKYFITLLLLALSNTAHSFEDLDQILKLESPPPGVVIEITSGDKKYLSKIIDELKSDIVKINTKFKDMPIAIVSHAKESLALSSKSINTNDKLHSEIKSLSDSSNTTVHVCGTYASWYGLSEEDFPEYINVSPTGPLQVDDYLELGYLHIRL